MDVKKDATISRGELAEQLTSILLEDDPNKEIQIGSLLAFEVRERLVLVL